MKKLFIMAMIVFKVALVAAALVLDANAQQEIDIIKETRAERVFEENQSAWSLWKEEAKAIIAEAERVEEARHGLSNDVWTETFDSDQTIIDHLYWLAGQKMVN